MNIFQMYIANGERCGFYVRRDSWSPKTVALVMAIDGKASGPLPGEPPYHATRRPPKMTLRNPFVTMAILGPSGLQFDQELTSPGTGGYTLLGPDDPAARLLMEFIERVK